PGNALPGRLCLPGVRHGLSARRSLASSAFPGRAWERDRHFARSIVTIMIAVLSLTANSAGRRSEEHTSELQSQSNLVCRLLLEKKKETANATGPLCSGTPPAPMAPGPFRAALADAAEIPFA